jgi:hypothetical protein
MLEEQEQRIWHDIVTLDESWFYSSTNPESVWLRRDEKFLRGHVSSFNAKD